MRTSLLACINPKQHGSCEKTMAKSSLHLEDMHAVQAPCKHMAMLALHIHCACYMHHGRRDTRHKNVEVIQHPVVVVNHSLKSKPPKWGHPSW